MATFIVTWRLFLQGDSAVEAESSLEAEKKIEQMTTEDLLGYDGTTVVDEDFEFLDFASEVDT